MQFTRMSDNCIKNFGAKYGSCSIVESVSVSVAVMMSVVRMSMTMANVAVVTETESNLIEIR